MLSIRNANQLKRDKDETLETLKALKETNYDDNVRSNLLKIKLETKLKKLETELKKLHIQQPKITIRDFHIKQHHGDAGGTKYRHRKKNKSDTKVKKIIGHKKSSKNIKVKKNKTRRKKNQHNKKLC
jgi:hypothetical protein